MMPDSLVTNMLDVSPQHRITVNAVVVRSDT